MEWLESRLPDTATKGAMPPNGCQIWHEDSQGRRHGPCLKWYPGSNQLRSATQYIHGQRHGQHISWHPNGAIDVTGSYVDDHESGEWTRHDDTSTLLFECQCVEGRGEGPAQSYYPSGQIARTWTYKDGAEHGRSQVYDIEGKPCLDEHYKDGIRHGQRRAWVGGVLIEETHWVNGTQHGPHRKWWFNGNPCETGQFEDGCRAGLWVSEYFTGGPMWSGEYKSGLRHGQWQFFDIRSSVIGQAQYCDGQPTSGTGTITAETATADNTYMPDSTAVLRSAFVSGGPVPTTVITGFLGAGKTTAITHLLNSRPAGETWAVYINEYGEVGIDAAMFPGDDGLVIEELSGGCICCTSNLPFVEGLGALLAKMRPDHLIIEPTGLADPGALTSSLTLRLPDQLDIRAIVCLVDPRRLADNRYVNNPIYQAQINQCDLLVANRCDLAQPIHMEKFRTLAASMDAIPTIETQQGRMDASWLARVRRDRPAAPITHPIHVDAHGFIFEEGARFEYKLLEQTLQRLLEDPALFPDGWLRAKGFFPLEESSLVVNADLQEHRVSLHWSPSAATGPGRLEIVAHQVANHSHDETWAKMKAALLDCIVT